MRRHSVKRGAEFPAGAGRLLPFPLASPDAPGAVAQLVAHLVRNEGVRGSSPLSSTNGWCPGEPLTPSLRTGMRYQLRRGPVRPETRGETVAADPRPPGIRHPS